jgi:hypothetical protein
MQNSICRAPRVGDRVLGGASSDQILAPLAPAYSVGKSAGGLANSGMTDAKRAALSVEDPVYRFSYVSIFFSTWENLRDINTNCGDSVEVSGRRFN